MKTILALTAFFAAAQSAKIMRYHKTPLVEKPGTFMDFKLQREQSRRAISLVANSVPKARFQQYFKNVPVYDGYAIGPLHGIMNDTVIIGHIVEGIEADVKSVYPKIPMSETLDTVKKIHSRGPKTVFQRHAATLYIWVDQQSTARLVYKTDTLIYDEGVATPRREIMFIDANTATVYFKFEGLTTRHTGRRLLQAATAGAADGVGGNQKTGKYEYGTDYESLQITEDGSGGCIMNTTNVKTCDLKNARSYSCLYGPYDFTCPTSPEKKTNGAYCPLNDAHAYGFVVFDMYDDWFSSRPITQQLEQRVHYGNSYENAFWDGSAMTFGDGGNTFYPLVSLDVVAHEVSHGVTEQNSGLEYHSQSGGMNEAFSDMAGEAAKYYLRNTNNWLVGEEIFKGNGALRYFEKPSQDGRSIDDATQYYSGLDVHYSSGVYNRAFYNVANAAGYNTQKAFEVFYEANVIYWSATSTFSEGACGVLAAATDIGYGTQAIQDAFSLVKVSTSSCASIKEPVQITREFPVWA